MSQIDFKNNINQRYSLRTVIAMLASKKINQSEIASIILEYYCNQVTEGSNEINAIHEHEFQK